jgi:hypothetical protein
MADDRSITGSAAAEDDVHDDDELAEVLAAELERYSTGTVPVVPRAPVQPEELMQPLAVPRLEPQGGGERQEPDRVAEPVVRESAFARRAAEVERAMRHAAPPVAEPSVAEPPVAEPPGADTSESFRRSVRPTGRRSTTGPIVQPGALPTADDLPVKRRTGFRPPPSAVETPPRVEPLDRVLPTGPIALPEATASLLEAMISDATGPVPVVHDHQHARHAAPSVEPEPQIGALPGADRSEEAPADGLYDDWEQSLRSIGRPRASWEQDDEIVPTGGDPDLPTVAIPILRRGSASWTPSDPQPPATPPALQEPGSGHRGAHALPVELAVPDAPTEPVERRRRSGRRRAAVPDDAFPAPAPMEQAPVEQAPAEQDSTDSTEQTAAERAPMDRAPVEQAPSAPTTPPTGAQRIEPPRTDPARAEPGRSAPAFLDQDLFDDAAFEIVEDRSAPEDPYAPTIDVEDDGIDEVAVDYPVVSAATTGAIDLPQVESRSRTTPVLIDRVRTAILQLPSVPASPTGSGAAAIVGRWFGAFASPLTLVLAFGLAAAGSGPAAAVAVLAGALLAVPAVVRSTIWSARAADDAAMHETAVLGDRAGRAVALVLLLARLGAAATVLLLIGATAGSWADRTGALGLGSSSAALAACTVAAVLGILCAALPARATAILTLLAAVVGAVGTLLIALVLAPNGGAPLATTAAGAVAGAVGGFLAVGLLLVLCGSDVARWRTDIANPVSTAVGSAVAVVCGAVLVAAGTVLASRLTAGDSPVDEFAAALSDASASAFAAPMLVILLISSLTLPALLLRSSGAAAARLLGAGRPVRLGTVAAGLLALAGALAMLAAGVDPAGAALAAAAVCGVPVAAWAGLLVVTGSARRPLTSAVGLGVATLVGWLLCDGLVPGAGSPLLTALSVPASTGLRGGPALGLAAALLIGVVAGLLSGPGRMRPPRPGADPADTVEG